jgi:lipid-binding SYLF domain-containing protein
MFKRTFAMALAGMAFATAGAIGSHAKADYAEAKDIVDSSKITIQRLIRSPETPQVKSLLAKAKGVMIFPQILKGAFFIGGEGGSGVLMSKYANGAWSYPAFYTMGSVSFGLQIGGQSSEAVLLIMTQRGLDSIINDQVKLGADLSAAAGPVGIGAEASTTTATGADIYVYSLNKGLFIGAALEGAVIAKRKDWNQEFYKGTYSPTQIVRENRAQNPDADALRAAVEAGA